MAIPSRDRDAELLAGDENRLPQRRFDPLRDVDRGLGRLDAFKQDRELVPSKPGDRVARPKVSVQAARGLDEEFVPNRVREAVVDQLETVDVHEQNGVARPGPECAGQRDAEPVHKKGAVGQAGERVVKGVVAQLFLGRLPVGDVGHAPGHPQRVPLAVPDGKAAVEDPPIVPVLVAHPVLDLEMLRLAREMGVDQRPHGFQVIGVDALEPGLVGTAELSVQVAQDLLPARTEVKVVGDHVPVPDPVIGPLDRKRVAFAALAQLGQCGVVRDRVADRSLKKRRVELVLREEVGHAQLGRLQVQVREVGLPGEHDHRGDVVAECFRDQAEAGLRTEPVVDQIDVVAALQDGGARLS